MADTPHPDDYHADVSRGTKLGGQGHDFRRSKTPEERRTERAARYAAAHKHRGGRGINIFRDKTVEADPNQDQGGQQKATIKQAVIFVNGAYILTGLYTNGASNPP